jgi:hypothetical protein
MGFREVIAWIGLSPCRNEPVSRSIMAEAPADHGRGGRSLYVGRIKDFMVQHVPFALRKPTSIATIHEWSSTIEERPRSTPGGAIQ